MNLEDQVCSLELAKLLKELGVKQESEYTWEHNPQKNLTRLKTSGVRGCGRCGAVINGIPSPNLTTERYSAFSVAELGEMLKPVVKNRDDFNLDLPYWYDAYGKPMWQWEAGRNKDDYSDCADTEADARAKMLIYLLENKLLTL